MTKVAVVAHQKKSLGGGLHELRQLLEEQGITDPLWYEVPKSRYAPKFAKKAIAQGAEILFVWGGDGTVQRCVDAVVGEDVDLAILPAGTANLLATNLGIPIDLHKALDIGLHGMRRRLDVGVMNGNHFAVMAGVGFDAIMMQNAEGKMKDRFGRLAYVWTGARATSTDARKARVYVDNKLWFKGKTTCVLLGQMSTLGRGVVAFPDSKPDDGLLDIGVVTAKNTREWLRVAGRLAIGDANGSPLTKMTQGHTIVIKLNRTTAYELDGGARKGRKIHKAHVRSDAITVRVPSPESP
jgi:diacylglycerol kinase (ATP)